MIHSLRGEASCSHTVPRHKKRETNTGRIDTAETTIGIRRHVVLYNRLHIAEGKPLQLAVSACICRALETGPLLFYDAGASLSRSLESPHKTRAHRDFVQQALVVHMPGGGEPSPAGPPHPSDLGNPDPLRCLERVHLFSVVFAFAGLKTPSPCPVHLGTPPWNRASGLSRGPRSRRSLRRRCAAIQGPLPCAA